MLIETSDYMRFSNHDRTSGVHSLSLFIERVGFDSKSRGACHKTDCGHSRTPQSVAFMFLNLSAEAQRNGEAGIIQLIHYYRDDSEE